MFDFLIKKFIKNSDAVKDESVRRKYGYLTGISGVILNAIMCSAKIITGLITGAISIVSDGVNNLSDAGSSVITLFGFKLSSKKPDKKHPYGHGRIEYFAGLTVSIIILTVAIGLFKDSVEKIINGEFVSFADNKTFTVTVCVLTVSILIKLWMALFNGYCGKKINSVAMKATALDSVTDCISTAVVLICAVLSKFISGVPIDAICGIVVSLFIAFTGIRSVLDIVNLLMGEAPDPELVGEIAEFVKNFNENVVGIHDFMIHDYGPGRKIIILHVEVPAEGNILEMHDTIDNIERELEKKFNCIATIHMDPVVTTSERVNELKEVCTNIVKGINGEFTIHDFRMNEGATHANVIFDIVIPRDCDMLPERVESEVINKIKEYDGKLSAVIKVEYPLV